MNTAQDAHDAVDAIVAQWKQEIPTLASENMALIGRIRRISMMLNAYLEQEFVKHSLNNWQFDVLATLRRSGPPYTLTPTALFSSMMVSSGTMSTRLKHLEADGLIERLPNPEDARSLLVKLSDKGFELIEKAVFPHVDNEARLLASLPQEVRQRLEADVKLLLKVVEEAVGG
ncbi:MarR family transcriptional regulator [Pasteurellaceae bacterium RH1A]|nr:MarR family transcriptional regulator [Pasteurellaceae bacterium RH1A]